MRKNENPLIVFYDGTCGLCHGLVRFLLSHDIQGTKFRFAALDSAVFHHKISKGEAQLLGDTLIVATPTGEILSRSRAIARLCAYLGGYWRFFGGLLLLIPRPLADKVYDGVAKVRHRLVKRPKDSCPNIPSALRERFL